MIPDNALLKQRYHILSKVGEGGFGAVYKAEDTTFDNRLVAVKEMSDAGLSAQELAAKSSLMEAILAESTALHGRPMVNGLPLVAVMALSRSGMPPLATLCSPIGIVLLPLEL